MISLGEVKVFICRCCEGEHHSKEEHQSYIRITMQEPGFIEVCSHCAKREFPKKHLELTMGKEACRKYKLSKKKAGKRNFQWSAGSPMPLNKLDT